MKTLLSPPAAVALVMRMLFSLGPKEPPRMGKLAGVTRPTFFTMAKPMIELKRLAGNVMPVFRPAQRKISHIPISTEQRTDLDEPR